MELRFYTLNPRACKTYVIGSDSREVILIDPVIEHLNDYLVFLKKNEFKLTQIIDTHTHADHISGAAALKDITECEYIMHENAPSQCITIRVKEGDVLKSDKVSVKVMYSPGHTNDSISLILSDRILTGDALFLDESGAGRDDLPGGDPIAHWETLKRFRELNDSLIVYPAHQYRDRKPSSLAQQKKTNPHLKIRTKEAYIQYIEDLRLEPADWMKDVLKANYACARDPKAVWIPVDLPACEVKGTLEHGVNEVVPEIMSVEELKHRFNENQAPLLLDVRESHELTGPLGHLKGIIHIPIGKLTAKLAELESQIEEEITIVCRSGARAYTAAQIMTQAGFKHVYVLNGGMISWRLHEKRSLKA
ncbi:MAG: rhodanese-like domain-containing protein [Candidatus Hermodarchaeota archaeon]